MKARAMGFARFGQRAFDRAWKLENRGFGGGAICLDRLLIFRLTTPRSKLIQAVCVQSSGPAPFLPAPACSVDVSWGGSPGAIFS